MCDLNKLTTILEAQAIGIDLIETPSALGGVFVDDETLKLVADLEVVAEHFDGGLQEAIGVMLQCMRKAEGEGEDPFEAARDWLDGWLEQDAAELMLC